MKLRVDLFDEYGKWVYGGGVDVSGNIPIYSEVFKKHLMDKQTIATNEVLNSHIVLITPNKDNPLSIPYFSRIFPVGSFEYVEEQGT